jgi:hypothetical protein
MKTIIGELSPGDVFYFGVGDMGVLLEKDSSIDGDPDFPMSLVLGISWWHGVSPFELSNQCPVVHVKGQRRIAQINKATQRYYETLREV